MVKLFKGIYYLFFVSPLHSILQLFEKKVIITCPVLDAVITNRIRMKGARKWKKKNIKAT